MLSFLIIFFFCFQFPVKLKSTNPARSIIEFRLTKYQNKEVLIYKDYMFRKFIGRAYRSHWICLKPGCNGQVMYNELKGGSITIVQNHQAECVPNKNIM